MPATFLPPSIDFLPAEYLQQHAKRKGMPYRMVIVAICAALVGLAHASQAYFAHRTQAELQDIGPQFDLVTRLNAQLGELQAKAQGVRAAAELHAYLRHPWPRSQLLAAIYARVPDSITLGELRIQRDAGPRDTGPRKSQAERQAEEQALARLAPAARDLKALRETYDHAPTTIHLTGITDSGPAVHRFLADLGEYDLFTKVELLGIENAGAESGDRLRFAAVIDIRPGYGQPGGPPAGKPPVVAAATPSAGGKP